MVFNTTFNNISVVLVMETEENHGQVASHWQTLLHNVVSSKPRYEWDSSSQVDVKLTTIGSRPRRLLVSFFLSLQTLLCNKILSMTKHIDQLKIVT